MAAFFRGRLRRLTKTHVRPRLKARLPRVEQLEARALLHAGGPVIQAEHDAVMNLVAYSDVTHMAVASGDWLDPATWDNGVPGDGANVLIPAGLAVDVDGIVSARLHTVRVDGTLDFATVVDTSLFVDTMVVDPAGTLNIGTASNPIESDVSASITIIDTGAIDTNWDPMHVSRGLISHGTANLYGAAVTAFSALATAPVKGSSTLVLSEAPTGWDVGDTIVVTGVSDGKAARDEELRQIVAVNGTQVTVSPLSNDHVPPRGDLSMYVANLDRNIVIRSENAQAVDRRGHVMFMHTPRAEVHNVLFSELGRTDKMLPLDNGQYDADGHLVAGTGTNQVGRYAVHFHRTGTGVGTQPASITGSVALGSPGWGIVNHSSYVLATDNVVLNVTGSSFVAEAGDEIGSFEHNLALRSFGSSDAILSRKEIEDFGQTGVGFWMQGPGVAVVDNVAVGHAMAGYVYLFINGVTDPTTGNLTEFPTHNLIDPSIANGASSVKLSKVPLRAFRGNVAFASLKGLEIWMHRPENAPLDSSEIEDFTGWNLRGNGVTTMYTEDLTFDGIDLLGNVSRRTSSAFDTDFTNESLTYRNLRLEEWAIGIDVPHNGQSVIESGYLNNIVNINVPNSQPNNRGAHGRSLQIDRAIQFGTLTEAQLQGQTQYDVHMPYTRYPNAGYEWVGFLFDRDTITYGDQQLYYTPQARGNVFFNSTNTPSFVPAPLVGKSNLTLWNSYKLPIGGFLPPTNAANSNPRISGLVGSRSVQFAPLTLISPQYSQTRVGYGLVIESLNGTRYKETINLEAGWNLVVRTISGVKQGFLIYAQ